MKDRLAFQRILFGSLNVTRTRLSLCQWVRVHITLQNGFNNMVFINLEVQRSLSKMVTWPGLSAPKASRNWAFTLLDLHYSLNARGSLSGVSHHDKPQGQFRAFRRCSGIWPITLFQIFLSSGEDRHGTCRSLYAYSKCVRGECNQSRKGTYSLNLTG